MLIRMRIIDNVWNKRHSAQTISAGRFAYLLLGLIKIALTAARESAIPYGTTYWSFQSIR
jgi:hypothetical protein